MVCRSQGLPWHYDALYLRPLFVRSAVTEFISRTTRLLLRLKIGFRIRTSFVAILLASVERSECCWAVYADSLAIGLAMQLVRRYSSLEDVHLAMVAWAPHKLRKAVSIIDRHLAEEQEGRVAPRVVASRLA